MLTPDLIYEVCLSLSKALLPKILLENPGFRKRWESLRTKVVKRKINDEVGFLTYVEDEPIALNMLNYSITWKDGKREGTEMIYRNGGGLHYANHYRQGKPHGRCTSWFPNGQKDAIITYDNGVPIWGEWYLPDGRLDREGFATGHQLPQHLIYFPPVNGAGPYL